MIDVLIATLSDAAKLATVLPHIASLSPSLINAAMLMSIDLKRGTQALRRHKITTLIDAVRANPTAVIVSLKLDALGSTGIAEIVVPATIGRSRAKLELVVPGSHQPRPDPSLIAIVAQARHWFELLATGKRTSIHGVAKTEHVTPAYVRQVIGAAFLAPDIVTAIVKGRQPRALTSAALKTMLPLPESWPEQRAMIAALD